MPDGLTKPTLHTPPAKPNDQTRFRVTPFTTFAARRMGFRFAVYDVNPPHTFDRDAIVFCRTEALAVDTALVLNMLAPRLAQPGFLTARELLDIAGRILP